MTSLLPARSQASVEVAEMFNYRRDSKELCSCGLSPQIHTMHAERFSIKYATVQNCFVYLPETWLPRFSNTNRVVRVNHKDRDFFFSWQSQPGTDRFLRLSATFARALGIREGDEVDVSAENYPASVSSVVVVPKSVQDWEIVELQSNRIQESLLNQVNVVALNQQIVVWVSKFLSVVLNVESLEPRYKFGRLEPFTEVIVSQARKEVNEEERGDNEGKESTTSGESAAWKMFKNFVPRILSSKMGGKGGDEEEEGRGLESSLESLLRKYSRRITSETFRVLPLRRIEDDKVSCNELLDSLFEQPYNIFIRRRFLPKNNRIRNEEEVFCRIKKVRENEQFVKITSTNYLRNDNNAVANFPTAIIARIFVIEDIFKKFPSKDYDAYYFADNSIHPSLYASDNLRRNLKLRIGAKTTIEIIDEPPELVTGIEIHPYDDEGGGLLSLGNFTDYIERLSRHKKVLLNSSSKLVLNDEKSCVIKLLPRDSSRVLLDYYDLKNLSIELKEPIKYPKNDMESVDETARISLLRISTRGLKPVLDECESILSLSLGLDRKLSFEYERENVLICGQIGSGKTTVCQILMRKFSTAPHFVHSHVIDCKSLKGKKVETLQKTFLPAILDCVYHQPAVLFVDDLETIAGRISEEEENTPDALNTARTAEMLFNLIREYQAAHHFAIVATSTGINKLSEKLAAPRGAYLFRTILSLPELEKEDRIEIVRLALEEKLNISKNIDWNKYGNKTEGWTAQDLMNFARKAVFTNWKRHVNIGAKGSPLLEESDLSKSIEKSTPMSLQGLNLYSGPGHSWSEIGGLSEVKESLIELLQWPLKYPELFKNAPIKQQGGVLIYGAPGTGKTMLAGAIAKECGLNFISVKGPELLSKYIGASEEAVRNVFEKANSAKPCVLFFDEFDSLAPRRGHDSTGVTDRVVNQFLAQLDGVEGRQGVAVVAASSRPDLLDPALLRPGRLDKALLCQLPNEFEREEILAAIIYRGVEKSPVDHSSNLDLKTLAKDTPGFTGADLNALVSQAKLSALEEGLANKKAQQEEKERRSKEEEKGKKFVQNNTGSMITVTITQEHLLDALRSTRPSLSASEKRKYETIYAKFSRSEASSADDNDVSTNRRNVNQRTTLA